MAVRGRLRIGMYSGGSFLWEAGDMKAFEWQF